MFHRRVKAIESNIEETYDETRHVSVIKDAQENFMEQDYLKSDQIKFVSAIDSKPVNPAYLKLMSLKQFMKLAHAEKQT